jgi:uncharacterized repeat protein (TIGR02543 family)
VTFDANGGSAAPPRTVAAGSAIGELPQSTKTGYTFDGWFTAQAGGEKATAATTVTGNVTYYAQWTPNAYMVSHTVTFKDGEETVDTYSRNYGAWLGPLPGRAKTGYTFRGWFTAQAGGEKVGEGTPVTQDATYYARWAADVYTVTFKDGKETVATYIRDSGAPLGALPGRAKTGDTFSGWFTAQAGGVKVGDGTPVTQDITYYAQWTVNIYTVTFKDGSKTVKSYGAAYGEKLGGLPKVSKKGHTFKGWYTKNKGGSKASANLRVKGDLSLYARWKADACKVTFKDGSKTVKSYGAAYGEELGGLPKVSKKGHTFKGWYTKNKGGSKASANLRVKGDLNLYARWKADACTVKFVNGASVKTYKRAYGSELGKLPRPAKKGYIFKGWYTKKDGGRKVGAGTKAWADGTYYARWARGATTVNAYYVQLHRKPYDSFKEDTWGRFPVSLAYISFSENPL